MYCGHVLQVSRGYLSDRRVHPVVLCQDGHAAQHQHMEDAHAPASTTRAEAEGGVQNFIVHVDSL